MSTPNCPGTVEVEAASLSGGPAASPDEFPAFFVFVVVAEPLLHRPVFDEFDPVRGPATIFGGQITTLPLAPELLGYNQRRPTPEKGIYHHISCVGGGEDHLPNQFLGLLCRMRGLLVHPVARSRISMTSFGFAPNGCGVQLSRFFPFPKLLVFACG